MGGWKQAMVHLSHSSQNIPEGVLRRAIPGLDLSQQWLPGELWWALPTLWVSSPTKAVSEEFREQFLHRRRELLTGMSLHR